MVCTIMPALMGDSALLDTMSSRFRRCDMASPSTSTARRLMSRGGLRVRKDGVTAAGID
jgi:hypothetical protein